MNLSILDYGMGNLRSVQKALEHVGATAERTADHARVLDADALVLPGVGAFPEAMRRLRDLGLETLIADRAAAGVPILGICLGMQLLFDSSTELEGAAGLGLVQGPVEPLRADGLKVPHIGWSPVSRGRSSALFDGIDDGTPFYFVHSFDPRPANARDTLGTADYGQPFACAVERGSIYGVQFHPEKSSAAGLRLLANFVSISSR